MLGDVNAQTNEERRPLMRRLFRIVALFLAACWPFAVIEAIVELCGVAPLRAPPLAVINKSDQELFQDQGSGFRFSPHWIWEPRPGAEFSGDIVNEQCRRGPLVAEESDGRFRIVTLGDSSTFGLNVKDSECFARRVESKLRVRREDVDVVNLGCVGFSVVQALEIYKAKGRRYSPQIVIVAVGAVNEQFFADGGLTDRAKIKHYTQVTVRMKEIFERFSTYRWLESALAPTSRQSRTASSLRSQERVTLDDFEATLLELDAEVRADGGRMLVVVPPRRKDAEDVFPKCMTYTIRLQEIVKRSALPAIDLFQEFRALDDADPVVAAAPDRSPLFCDGFHPSVAGHELYADRLIERLDSLSWIPARGVRR